MLFNSIEFIVFFLPIVAIIYFTLGKFSHNVAIFWMLSASLFFYGWWDYRNIPIILSSITINYVVASLLTKRDHRRRKLILIVGVSLNLLILCYYKYSYFLASQFNSGAEVFFPKINDLPIGISFFTFTQIAFLVDVYRRKASELSIPRFVLFVTYFPHLIAGPILHHSEMMPQFADSSRSKFKINNLCVGVTIFIIGLAKKLLLADQISAYVGPTFQQASLGELPMFLDAWAAALSYTMQIYFDFSGYSDMAVGISLMFGVYLPLNFASPYQATSIIEFWRRWHMTLSRFLRDYVYFSLGGNRLGVWRRHLNLMITMLLGGLWHGAGWTFIIWGGIHGALLGVNHLWRHVAPRLVGDKFLASRFWSFLAWGLTFSCVVVAWVFFRAPSFSVALSVLKGMAGLNGIAVPINWGNYVNEPWFERLGVRFMPLTTLKTPEIFGIFVLGAIAFLAPNMQKIMRLDHHDETNSAKSNGRGLSLRWQPTTTWAVMVGLLGGLAILNINRISEFLYFQF